jgi:hypothetical protein
VRFWNQSLTVRGGADKYDPAVASDALILNCAFIAIHSENYRTLH